jgi:predicted DNA-binding transcriptional regulator AlpA
MAQSHHDANLRKVLQMDDFNRDQLLSVRDTAALYGCSVATVWRNAGQSIPAPFRIGGMTRWSKSEVLASIEAAKAERNAA